MCARGHYIAKSRQECWLKLVSSDRCHPTGKLKWATEKYVRIACAQGALEWSIFLLFERVIAFESAGYHCSFVSVQGQRWLRCDGSLWT